MSDKENIIALLKDLDVEIEKTIKDNNDPNLSFLKAYEKLFFKLSTEAAKEYRAKWISYLKEVHLIKEKKAEKCRLKAKAMKHDGESKSFYLFWTKYDKNIQSKGDLFDDSEKQDILCDLLFADDQINVESLNLAETKAYLFKKYRSPDDIRNYILGTFSDYQMGHRKDIDGLQTLIEALQSAIPQAKPIESGAPELFEWLFELVYGRIAEELQLQFWNDYPGGKSCPKKLFAFLEKQLENLKADRHARKSDDDEKKPNWDDMEKERIFSMITEYFSNLSAKNSHKNKSQMSTDNLFSDKWNIDINDLTIKDKILGVGSFGQVFEGTLTSKSGRSTKVAVKKRLPKMNDTQMIEEANKMKRFDHPNVLKMYGICRMKEEVCLVMEIMTENLRSYLDTNRQYNSMLIVDQILDGLIYLEGKQCIHCDIASRNILVNVSNHKVCLVKIADFGCTRLFADNAKNEHLKTIRNFTIAPEVYKSKTQYTVKSDVWSLGIVLWEIFAGEKVPFQSWHLKFSQPSQKLDEFMNQVKGGKRLDCPKHDIKCPEKDCPLYSILTNCWNLNPSVRPSYKEIKRLAFKF